MTDEPGGNPSGHYKLRLFVTGSTPRSTRAIANMRKICEENLHQVDVEKADGCDSEREIADFDERKMSIEDQESNGDVKDDGPDNNEAGVEFAQRVPID